MKLHKYVRQPALTEAEKQAQSHLPPHEYERRQALLKHRRELQRMQRQVDLVANATCGRCRLPFLGRGNRCQCPVRKPERSVAQVQ